MCSFLELWRHTRYGTADWLRTAQRHYGIKVFICSFQYTVAPHTQAPYSHLSLTSSNAWHRTMLCPPPIVQADHTCIAQAPQLHIVVLWCVAAIHSVILCTSWQSPEYFWPGVRYFWLVDDEQKSMNMLKSQCDVHELAFTQVVWLKTFCMPFRMYIYDKFTTISVTTNVWCYEMIRTSSDTVIWSTT